MMNFSTMNCLWIVLTTMIIFFMQPGFAMLEVGFTRAKNAGNVIMKNYMDFIIGFIAFWLIGFGILMGRIDLFSNGTYETGNIPPVLFMVFQAMFCATAATIVSGAMAERTKFAAYLIYSFAISALIYPVEAHWIWGNGFISKMQVFSSAVFHDCAGGTVVHLTGGTAALIGAIMLGPRIGKYDSKGKSNAIPGHNITLSALGAFLLWFAWLGFNTSSLRGVDSAEKLDQIVNILLVTNLSAAFSALTTMFFTWKRYHKPDISMTINGVLGGLVASTAGCDVLSPKSAMILGILAGYCTVAGIEFIDRKLKIDDPVGASAVHGLCGFLGTIAVGLFSKETGLFITGHPGQLFIQLLGAGTVICYVSVCMFLLFWLIDKTIGLRVSSEEEIGGLDFGEHSLVSAYYDLVPESKDRFLSAQGKIQEYLSADNENLSDSVSTVSYQAISSVVIICKESRFEMLKKALVDIGVYGITVSKVSGCSLQKARAEYYRGSELKTLLIPKIRVEVVVNRISVQEIIQVVRNVLYTGRIGDGKIFVYDVRNVIKIRTGEEGEGALQDPESYFDYEE